MGSLATANTRDLLTLNGGSGNDTFAILGNSGAINMVGGSGRDRVVLSEVFNDIVGVNKSARFADFDASDDSVISTFSSADLVGKTIERQLSDDGLTLNQLISPPGSISEGLNYSPAQDPVLVEALPSFSSNGDHYATVALVTAVQQAALASG
jgi:Ca2+-binding RTX toxin-like protein